MKKIKYKYVIISALLSVALFFSISAKSSMEKAGGNPYIPDPCEDCMDCDLGDCF